MFLQLKLTCWAANSCWLCMPTNNFAWQWTVYDIILYNKKKKETLCFYTFFTKQMFRICFRIIVLYIHNRQQCICWMPKKKKGGICRHYLRVSFVLQLLKYWRLDQTDFRFTWPLIVVTNAENKKCSILFWVFFFAEGKKNNQKHTSVKKFYNAITFFFCFDRPTTKKKLVYSCSF